MVKALPNTKKVKSRLILQTIIVVPVFVLVQLFFLIILWFISRPRWPRKNENWGI